MTIDTAIASPASWRPTLADQIRWSVERAIYRFRRRFGLLPESNSIRYAKSELARLRSGEPDEMQDAIERNVLDVIRAFDKAGHSGFSASYTIGLLEKLLRFEPITPLTGDDDEWNDISDTYGEPMWQNNRCGRVFKGADGRAYDIDGRVFVEPDGGAYTSRDSRVYVTFPYRPTTEYVYLKGRDAKGRFTKGAGR